MISDYTYGSAYLQHVTSNVQGSWYGLIHCSAEQNHCVSLFPGPCFCVCVCPSIPWPLFLCLCVPIYSLAPVSVFVCLFIPWPLFLCLCDPIYSLAPVSVSVFLFIPWSLFLCLFLFIPWPLFLCLCVPIYSLAPVSVSVCAYLFPGPCFCVRVCLSIPWPLFEDQTPSVWFRCLDMGAVRYLTSVTTCPQKGLCVCRPPLF